MDKNAFQQFRRVQIAELRPYVPGENLVPISISEPDRDNGSPKLGDMIARNPANHADQWLVAADYFAANFAPLASDDPCPDPVKSEETSSRVASIAGTIMAQLRKNPDATEVTLARADASAIAASALTQAPDNPGNFLDRLKLERDQLDGRLIKLNAYLADGAHDASPRHREMLREQSKCMSDLLAVLDERIADIGIDERSAAAGISNGE